MKKYQLSTVLIIIGLIVTDYLMVSNKNQVADSHPVVSARSEVSHGADCPCGADHSAGEQVKKKAAVISVAASKNVRSFDQWRNSHQSGTSTLSVEDISHGVALAKQRKASMLEMMKNSPELALEHALSWADYHALPAEIQAHVEKPFSQRGDFLVLPNCGNFTPGGQGPSADSHQVLIAGKRYDSTGYGRRLHLGTKENTPLQGISLNGFVVVRPAPLQQLSAADAKALRGQFPVANRDANRDFSTGKPITGSPTIALGGGKLFYFSNAAELEKTNKKLKDLDRLPGPHTGAQAIFLQASAGGDSASNNIESGIDWSSIEESAQLQASSWTETKKKVFFIRVDFSDNTGASTLETTLANVLNTTVSDSIRDMSYGKTWIEADVSSMVVRLPSPTTTYLPSNNDLLRNDAIAAFNALSTGINLGDYDIVGVHFKSIGMTSSSGFSYAGLAGGSRQWLQGTTNAGVIIHEFGHNYGLGHASFWDTSGASVIGAGTSDEYGNNFDIMGNGPDPEGHFHPQGKQKIAWLGTGQWVDTAASGSGTHRLYRGDHKDTTGVRGLRVPKDAGSNHYYWVGYRRAITSNNYLQGGVVLNWEKSGRSWLIDTTPGSAAGRSDSGVLIGQTYSDTVAGIHVTPVAQGGSSPNEWIDVTVNIGAFPGNVAPTATLSGPSTGAARTPLMFSVAASDGNSDTLAYSWDFGDGAVIQNQNSVSHTWDLGGTYNVSVTVTDMKGGTVTKSMNVTVTDPLTNWNIGNVGQSLDMYGATYLNGRFILTSYRYSYFSLDGVNWSETNITSNFRNGAVAYGAGKYVLTGRDWDGSGWTTTAFYSSDGKHWKPGTVPTQDYPMAVAYGGGRFVAVGRNGTSMYSTDGITWTAGSTIGSLHLRAIDFANGEFITVGDDQVFASSDGITWVDRSASTGLASWHNFNAVVYGEGKWFAGGWYSGIRYSTDQGVTWQAAAMPAGKNYEINAIHIAEGAYVANAERRSDNTPVLLVSSDGLTWKEGVPSNLTESDSLTYGNGVFLSAQGSSGATQYSDGLFPSNQPPTATLSGPSTASARATVQFTSSASDPDGDDLIYIWDFQDGTDLVTGASASHTFPTGGSYTVKLSVVDGKGGIATKTQAVTVSDPLNNWTQRASGTSANLQDIASGGGRLMAVGRSSGTYRTSTDGVTWTGGQIGNNRSLFGIVHDGSQFIAVGQNYDFSVPDWVGVIYTSTDGTSWTSAHSGGEILRDIEFNNGVYIATGDAGTILRSTNGTSWSSVSSGVSTNLHAVSYGDGDFVIAGANSSSQGATILTSSDGTSWTNTSAGAGTSQGFFHIKFLQDRFLASGFHTRFRVSTDGGDTFADTSLGNIRMPALAHGNGIYFAGGRYLSGGTGRLNLISTDGITWSSASASGSEDRNAAVFFQNTFITVGNSGEIWQSDVIPAPSGWVVWQGQQFPGLPALSGPYEDFDGDGIANLLEYITGTDPKSNSSFTQPTLTEENGYMTLTVTKAAGVSGFNLIVQASDDLDTWVTSNLTILTNDASMLKVRLNDLTTNPSVPKMFLRARATVTP
ncbi:MAG: PKD domain-containing protein [Akkermansiaceae bacterium]